MAATLKHADLRPGFWVRWFYSTNHKDIGTLWIISRNAESEGSRYLLETDQSAGR